MGFAVNKAQPGRSLRLKFSTFFADWVPVAIPRARKARLGAAGRNRRVELHKQPQPQGNQFVTEKRLSPRFPLDTEIRVYARNCPVVRGHTVDLSESGIAAMLLVEVPLGEVVRLEFRVPLGEVEVQAVARQRNAFRYGFQFIETGVAHDIIGRTCRELAVQHLMPDRHVR